MRKTSKDTDGGFDEALRLAGNWGFWQKKVFIIAHMSQVFCAIHAVSSAFLSFTPDHWCRVEGLAQLEEAAAAGGGGKTEENLYNRTLSGFDWRNYSIPWQNEWDGFESCEYYDYNYTSLIAALQGGEAASVDLPAPPPPDTPTASCDAWVFDKSIFESTLVSEFSLVCDRLWMMSTVQASYMIGLLFGSLIMGQLSDRFGRRTMCVLCAVSVTVVGICASFVETYMQFLALRFIIAFLCAGLMVISFVLVMEVVKPEARTMTGMMYAGFFGLGITILPGLAYLIRSWRNLELTIGILSSVLISYYWILPESPRWLASQRRHQEALKILKEIAKTNGKTLPPDLEVLSLISRVHDKQEKEAAVEAGGEDKGKESRLARWSRAVAGTFSDQVTLVRTPIMRRRCLISFFLWFVAASVYYGLIFSGANIKADPFLMIFSSGMVELPSAVVFIYPLDKYGRRPTMSGLFVACGLCLLAILAVPRDLIYVNLFLVNLGKFFTTAVFQLQYLFMVELMPTNVRNVAVGTCSMIARIGCVITPYIVTHLGEVHYALPFILFGVTSVGAGVLTLLLPETNRTLLPETVAEVEAKSM